MILVSLLTARLVCASEQESDGTYFVACDGPYEEELAEAAVLAVENRYMAAFCTAYDYQEHGNWHTFVVVCE